MNYEAVDGKSIISTGIGELRDRRIVIGDKTLILPASIRYQMRELDNWVASGKYAAEIFGVGLSKKKQGTTKVVEFIAPNPENIFRLDSGLLMSTNQNQLMRNLSDAQTVTLSQAEGGVILACKNDAEKTTDMIFALDGQGSIDYSFIRTDLNQLFGFELPPTIEELNELLVKERRIQIIVGFDAVVNTRQAFITKSFLKRVSQKASETGLEIGFTVHHHPSLAIAALILRDQNMDSRQKFYYESLGYSEADMDCMQRLGADFFEIRALGNPHHPFDSNAGVTSRYFRS